MRKGRRKNVKAISIAENQLDCELSLKLTSIGLDISEKLAEQHVRDILTEAKERCVPVTIDMEDYSRCGTLELYKRCKPDFRCSAPSFRLICTAQLKTSAV